MDWDAKTLVSPLAKQGIKNIDVPSTSAVLVLTVGHNTMKRKTSHSNWKGKAIKEVDHRASKMERSKRVVTQGLKESRRLKHGELKFVMGNRKIMPVIRIGKFVWNEVEGLLDLVHHRYVWDHMDLPQKMETILLSVDEEPIVNTNTQQKVVTPVKPDDISLPIRRTSGRVSKPLEFYYGFHIEKDKISDSTLSELDKPPNYKEAMASPKASKWKEAMKSEI
ncbi:hypothetical protein Tco_0456481 [Tanacetum coccineum]